MSGDSGNNEAHTHGSGQAVNVVIGTSTGRWIFAGIIILIIVIIFTDRTSVGAETKATDAQLAANHYSDEMRMAEYWIQSADAACLAKGITLPPDPFAKIGHK